MGSSPLRSRRKISQCPKSEKGANRYYEVPTRPTVCDQARGIHNRFPGRQEGHDARRQDPNEKDSVTFVNLFFGTTRKRPGESWALFTLKSCSRRKFGVIVLSLEKAETLTSNNSAGLPDRPACTCASHTRLHRHSTSARPRTQQVLA